MSDSILLDKPPSEAELVDKLVRGRLDKMMAMVTRPNSPHFAAWVHTLLKVTEVEYNGVSLSEDGLGTVAARNATAKIVISLTINQRCCNQTDNAHGGFLAWLVDICSSMPMVLLGGQESWRMPGVSANINVSYLAGIPMGTEINVVSTVLQKGRATATMEARIVDAKTAKLYALGLHATVDATPKKLTAPKYRL